MLKLSGLWKQKQIYSGYKLTKVWKIYYLTETKYIETLKLHEPHTIYINYHGIVYCISLQSTLLAMYEGILIFSIIKVSN